MARLLSVFNRYLYMGGEEKAVDRTYQDLAADHEMAACDFRSSDWTGPGAPGRLAQFRRTFYNPDSRRIFEKHVRDFQPHAVLFHNLYPVGSPSLYHAAKELGVPVMQFVHNFRPFSVGGTLYVDGEFTGESLRGNYWREVRKGAWQGSVLKSAIFALVLKRLHRSGWLGSVRAWMCCSQFMRDKFIQGAGLPAEQVHTLRYSYSPSPELTENQDGGYYLFLSRLVELKGVEVVLRAWEIVEKALGPKTPELHIGGEGPLADRVREAALKNKKIKYLGLVTGAAKSEAITSCRAMLAPSLWWEPLGLVTYEAYDHSKPMLAARSGGLVETVLPDQTGYLHKPGDIQGMAHDVILTEVLTPAERWAMGQAGRKWLVDNTGVEQWRKTFNEVLERIQGDLRFLGAPITKQKTAAGTLRRF